MSRGFKIAYNKALGLEQKTTSGLNALLEILNSWAAVTAGLPGDTLPDVVTLEQLSEVKWAWEKARESVCAALASDERARSAGGRCTTDPPLSDGRRILSAIRNVFLFYLLLGL